jgi:DNA replication protein DnaC
MLMNPTLEQLHALRLTGMAKAYQEQRQIADVESLSFDERLGLLLDREATERADRRLRTRLRQAKLRVAAAVEDIDFRHPRGLDKRQVLELAGCDWIREHHNLLITGATGAGKTYLACAFAHKACLEDFTARYLRLPRLFRELEIARADGRYPKLLAAYARTDLLVLDDWGLAPLTEAERRDLYEIFEERTGLRSTLVASQLPVGTWHAVVGDPTLADAILDRLVSNAHEIALRGDTIRPPRHAQRARRPSAAGNRAP